MLPVLEGFSGSNDVGWGSSIVELVWGRTSCLGRGGVLSLRLAEERYHGGLKLMSCRVQKTISFLRIRAEFGQITVYLGLVHRTGISPKH